MKPNGLGARLFATAQKLAEDVDPFERVMPPVWGGELEKVAMIAWNVGGQEGSVNEFCEAVRAEYEQAFEKHYGWKPRGKVTDGN